jgi:hypothetical protein
VPGTLKTSPPTPERVAQFQQLVRSWLWADRQRRAAADPKSDPLPPEVKRLLAPYKVEEAGGETTEQWAQRMVAADSEERGAAREVVACGRQLALDLEAHGYDSRPVLLVVHAADGGGGVPALAGTWPVARLEIDRLGMRLKVRPRAAQDSPSAPPAPVREPTPPAPPPPPADPPRFTLDLDGDGMRHVVANGKRLSYADGGRGGQLTKRHAGAAFLVALATGGRLPRIRPDALEDLRRALEKGTDQGLTITGGPDTYAFSAPVTVTERLRRHFAGRVSREGTSRAR